MILNSTHPNVSVFFVCLSAMVEPGEAVGAIGAQSISEPGTQMTLKVCLIDMMCLFCNGKHAMLLTYDLLSFAK